NELSSNTYGFLSSPFRLVSFRTAAPNSRGLSLAMLKLDVMITRSARQTRILAAQNKRYPDVLGTILYVRGIENVATMAAMSWPVSIQPMILLDCRKLNNLPKTPQKLSSSTAVTGPVMQYMVNKSTFSQDGSPYSRSQ